MTVDIDSLVKLSEAEIINKIGMAELPLIVYILDKKYSGEVRFADIGGDCAICYGNIAVANMSYLAAYVHFIKVRGNILEVEGNISVPTCFEKFCEFYPMINGEKYDCTFFGANLDLSLDNGDRYETRTAFRITVNTEAEKYRDKPVKITFAIETKGIRSICGKINSMRFAPAADVLADQYAVRDGMLLEIRDHAVVCGKCGDRRFSECEERFIRSTEDTLKERSEYVRGIRGEYFRRLKNKNKHIWLFFDRIDKADDNGEAMFRYVCSLKRTDIDCYFVISKNSPDHNRIKSIGNVIDALSFEHCVTLPLADLIITSQLNGYVENPYGEYEEYFRDIYHNAKVVFLQHGVTKDDQTLWLNRFYNDLYRIVASAPLEEKYFLEYDYFYGPENIWLTGMPRFDLLTEKKEKNILIIPTWRKQYMEQKFDEKTGVYRWRFKENFKTGDYYRAYNSLLNSRLLRMFCRIFGYGIVFMPHPIVQPYSEEFDMPRYVKRLPYNTPWRELFEKSALMITDYSSVAFDYAYTGKPVIYYQFDKEIFFKNHSYKEGYFDYSEMGFGEIVCTEKDLLRLIIKYLFNNCGNSELYVKRMKSFFAYNDRDNCKRIFDKLMSEAENA